MTGKTTLRGIGAPAGLSAGPKGRPATAIAVVFDGADLPRVAKQCARTIDDTIARFCSGNFSVRCLGFSPGFPYLDGLPERMHTPRLATPRMVDVAMAMRLVLEL